MTNFMEKAYAEKVDKESKPMHPPLGLKPTSLHRKSDFFYNPIWVTDISRDWEAVLHLGRYMSFKAKEHIPQSVNGEYGFYYLKYGKARGVYENPHMSYNGGDNKVSLFHVGEGTLLYDLVQYDQAPNYKVYALTPCEVYFFPAAHFLNESFAAHYPQLALSLIRSQALKNMYYMRRVVSIAGGNAFANTCKLMLDLSYSYGNALDVPLGVTHEEIASLLCVRRSWLGKILRRLKDEKVISKCTKARLVITDLDKLAQYANSG